MLPGFLLQTHLVLYADAKRNEYPSNSRGTDITSATGLGLLWCLGANSAMRIGERLAIF
jgi:hypothetical protein